ncbi:hypothetical protein EVAR_20569_1 [Eumeta japonica]|uniref:Uncharacterized protein n=1 Tax=Eumeta variegata TaxID=151549 RepID=A0A4C1UT49_EUMVA|nr:hypothetical protein EVAR_20569_1 [Eumeta japonica]
MHTVRAKEEVPGLPLSLGSADAGPLRRARAARAQRQRVRCLLLNIFNSLPEAGIENASSRIASFDEPVLCRSPPAIATYARPKDRVIDSSRVGEIIRTANEMVNFRCADGDLPFDRRIRRILESSFTRNVSRYRDTSAEIYNNKKVLVFYKNLRGKDLSVLLTRVGAAPRGRAARSVMCLPVRAKHFEQKKINFKLSLGLLAKPGLCASRSLIAAKRSPASAAQRRARTMHRPGLSHAMRDNWRHLQRLYGLDGLETCEDCERPRRAPSLDSLINSSEGAASSADASAPEDSDSGADTRAEPDPPKPIKKIYPERPKKCPQSYSSSSSGHMETIHEESTEPKVSVKEILARFENLTEKTDVQRTDYERNEEIDVARRTAAGGARAAVRGDDDSGRRSSERLEVEGRSYGTAFER